MAKRKTPQSSTEASDKTKWPSRFLEYRNIRSWRMIPYCLETLEDLADDLYKFADEPDTYRLNDFYNRIGMAEGTYYDLLPRCEKLKAAHEYAINRFASKREIGAMTGRLREGTIFRTLPHYCKIDKEQFEYRTKLSAQVKAETERPTQNIIVLKDMPTTDKVPERKDKE